jgi:ribonucleoside-diphosphate reductase alpha chain
MFDKITDRIKKLCYGLNDLVDAVKVAMRVIGFMMGFLRQN